VRVTGSSTSAQAQGYTQSKSTHYQAVPLLRPDEVMRLPANQVLIMRTGHAPLKAGQLIWYKTLSMKALACAETGVPHQVMIQHPFVHPIKTELSLLEAMET
jgi:type IV secretion system protein VirD4